MSWDDWKSTNFENFYGLKPPGDRLSYSHTSSVNHDRDTNSVPQNQALSTKSSCYLQHSDSGRIEDFHTSSQRLYEDYLRRKKAKQENKPFDFDSNYHTIYDLVKHYGFPGEQLAPEDYMERYPNASPRKYNSNLNNLRYHSQFDLDKKTEPNEGVFSEKLDSIKHYHSRDSLATPVQNLPGRETKSMGDVNDDFDYRNQFVPNNVVNSLQRTSEYVASLNQPNIYDTNSSTTTNLTQDSYSYHTTTSRAPTGYQVDSRPIYYSDWAANKTADNMTKNVGTNLNISFNTNEYGAAVEKSYYEGEAPLEYRRSANFDSELDKYLSWISTNSQHETGYQTMTSNENMNDKARVYDDLAIDNVLHQMSSKRPTPTEAFLSFYGIREEPNRIQVDLMLNKPRIDSSNAVPGFKSEPYIISFENTNLGSNRSIIDNIQPYLVGKDGRYIDDKDVSTGLALGAGERKNDEKDVVVQMKNEGEDIVNLYYKTRSNLSKDDLYLDFYGMKEFKIEEPEKEPDATPPSRPQPQQEKTQPPRSKSQPPSSTGRHNEDEKPVVRLEKNEPVIIIKKLTEQKTEPMTQPKSIIPVVMNPIAQENPMLRNKTQTVDSKPPLPPQPAPKTPASLTQQRAPPVVQPRLYIEEPISARPKVQQPTRPVAESHPVRDILGELTPGEKQLLGFALNGRTLSSDSSSLSSSESNPSVDDIEEDAVAPPVEPQSKFEPEFEYMPTAVRDLPPVEQPRDQNNKTYIYVNYPRRPPSSTISEPKSKPVTSTPMVVARSNESPSRSKARNDHSSVLTNPYLREKREENYLSPISNQQPRQTVVAQKPTQSLTASSPRHSRKETSSNNTSMNGSPNAMFGKATNVIERRGDHNKNLDEPFLPRANKPKVFVSEPKLFLPLTQRTPASIMEEYKNRPQLRIAPTQYRSNNHLDMIEAESALEMLHSPQPSSRIQNFNIYEEFLKKKQLQNNQRLGDQMFEDSNDSEEELEHIVPRVPQAAAPGATYSTTIPARKSSLTSSRNSNCDSHATTPKSKKSVGFDLRPRVLYPDEDPEITNILSSDDHERSDDDEINTAANPHIYMHPFLPPAQINHYQRTPVSEYRQDRFLMHHVQNPRLTRERKLSQ